MPLKRLGGGGTANTGLKPGANESLQETEMRPPACDRFALEQTAVQLVVAAGAYLGT